MKPARAPRLETRRAEELEAELLERSRAWIPAWAVDDDERDFGRALLRIAARFASEVAERLDRAGEKMRLGFLDWLAVPADAARPARLPVAFKLSDSAREAVLATAPTRLQVEAGGASVILETEKDVRLVPGALKALVGVDADRDAFYVSPPGLSSLAPLEPLPTQWQLKSFASAEATTLQLDPEIGLVPGMVVQVGGKQYRIDKADKDIVTIDPSLEDNQNEHATVDKVAAFAPFDGTARNQQRHELYIGHKELLDIAAAASIEVVGAKGLGSAVKWEYWGKPDTGEAAWLALSLADADAQAKSDALVLSKPKGSIEVLELVPGSASRWIRGSVGSLLPTDAPVRVDTFEIRVNCRNGAEPPDAADALPAAEGMANTTPLVLESVFFPLGKEPRQFDSFYLGSKEAFSKKGADVTLDFEIADTSFTALTVVRQGVFAGQVLAGVGQDGALHLFELNAQTGVVGRFRDREGLRPPPEQGSAESAAGVVLTQRPPGRLPVWLDTEPLPGGFFVAATARDTVWVWQEKALAPKASQWRSFDALPALETSSGASVTDLFFLEDTATLYALRAGQLWKRKWPDGPTWMPVPTKVGQAEVVLHAIVPVLGVSGDSLVSSAALGMVGVGGGSIYAVDKDGHCTKLSPTDVDADVRPF
ncbi:MAG TPA: hypothetical protein VJN68_10575, partial [Burkholderiaceae bacterium]|nr:hypothetical protein [Burkholderiaceae bacterium]